MKSTSQTPKFMLDPIHEIWIRDVRAVIYLDQFPFCIRYFATLGRVDRQVVPGGVSRRFDRDDLLMISEIARQAHSYMLLSEQGGCDSRQVVPGRVPDPEVQ